MDLSEIGRQFGLDEAQTRAAFEALAPVVAAGVRRNAASDGGLGDLLGAVLKGDHGRYLDDPAALGSRDSVADGNAILGHIFGSKDVSRGVAQQLSSQSGIGADILKKLLPVIAAMVMGQIAKKSFGGGQASGGGGSLGDILGSVLGGGQQAQGGGLGDSLGNVLGGALGHRRALPDAPGQLLDERTLVHGVIFMGQRDRGKKRERAVARGDEHEYEHESTSPSNVRARAR